MPLQAEGGRVEERAGASDLVSPGRDRAGRMALLIRNSVKLNRAPETGPIFD